MKKRGRPVLGAIAGFLFGTFLGVTLLAFGAVALDSTLLALLPVLFLVLGVGWALAAPLGGGGSRGDTAAPAQST